MNLHEYQAKQLFAEFNLPVPKNVVISSVDELAAACKQLGGQRWVAKAQVHAGGRGKAGGVKVCSDMDTLRQFVASLLGKNLVTYQTTAEGQPIHRMLIESPCDIAKELYLSMVLDREKRRLTVMASTEGGVDIEKVAHETPDRIFKLVLDPLLGVLPSHARQLGFKMGLELKQIQQLQHILQGLLKLYLQYDFSLLEINPLVISQQGDIICLDGKINIDDNALYRQPKIMGMRDSSQEDPKETLAKEKDLNYIALDGNIGCMVNGAGLAMATMDLIKLHGGLPANFLDVGGTADQARVIEAFKIILADPNVKSVLVNIFGGIVRCDLIAEGIIGAVKQVGIKVPVVVRLEGNNAELAGKILQQSGLNILAVSGLAEATQRVVQASKQ